MKGNTLVKRLTSFAAASAALTLSLTACAGPTDTATGTSEAENGLTTVKVGNLVYVGTAPFRIGVEKGFFEEEGLNIAETEGDSAAALGGQLTSGQLDIAFATAPFLVTAVSQGADLKAFASVDGVIDPADPSSGIVVKKDSPIDELADLNGKKIAIPGLGSLLHLVTIADIEEEGGDPSSVEMVQVPFPQMEQALESGNVDAIVPTEPFLSAALSTGARSLTGPEADIVPDASVTAWAASSTWLESNPDTAAAFTRAMNKSIEYARDNNEEMLEMMPEYTGLSAEQVKEMSFGTVLTSELNAESIADQAQLLVKHGFIEEAPTLEELVHEPGS